MSEEPVAVVSVTPAGSHLAATFADSIQASTSHELDLVLVVLGTPDGGDASPGVRVVQAAADTGYGAAANVGVRDTTAEYVVVCSPQIQWQPGSLDALLAAARRWSTGAVFGPRILTADGSTYPSARTLPMLGRGVGHALCARWWPSNPWTTGYRGGRGEPVERTAGWLSGSCLLLRRDAFDGIGGFDESYLAYFEDVDLGERFGRAGWHNVYVPSAVVVHTGVEVTGHETAWLATEHHRSAWLYLSRHYRGLRWLPVRVGLRVGLAVRGMWQSRRSD